MEGRRADWAKGDESNFKKALLTRYLEDQVLYNLTAPGNEANRVVMSHDGKDVRSRSANDVIVKINDQLTPPEAQNQILIKRERRKLSKDLCLSQGNKDNRLLAESHSKLSRSLDEGQFKSLYLDIPNQKELQTTGGRTRKRADLTKPQLHLRKYSDCSNNRTKNYEAPCTGRQNVSYEYNLDVHNHPTNTLVRGILHKVALPVFGGNERPISRKQTPSLSTLEGSIQDFNFCRDNEILRASMSSFKSSCSSFPEVEFDDSDYDRSCTSSPCSPLNITCRFPPINSEVHNQ